jgi:molybdenum cofactor cytidylyltransferase
MTAAGASDERSRRPVAGVVLAAGTSSRMGENKLFLRLSGETVLRRAVRTAVAAGLEPVLVVLGHESERARAELQGLRCTPVLNPDYVGGIHTSLRTGIAAVPEDAPGALVLLADMPFVTAEMVSAVVARYRGGEAPLVVSTYEGVDAPPMLYDRVLFAELRALDGDGCGKRVVKRHRSEALDVAWPAAALGDLDQPADVERARAALERA